MKYFYFQKKQVKKNDNSVIHYYAILWIKVSGYLWAVATLLNSGFMRANMVLGARWNKTCAYSILVKNYNPFILYQCQEIRKMSESISYTK